MKSAMTASRALPVLQKEKRPALSKPFFMKKTTDLTEIGNTSARIAVKKRKPREKIKN